MCLSIAIFFLVTTTALLVVTVTSDRPRSTLFRALAWSAVASLASTFAWTAVGGFQPVPSAIFTVQTFLYGIATLPLRNWAADYAWQLEQEQSKRRVRELMVEFDEQLEQMEESTRLRVIDACNRRLEREAAYEKWQEELEEEQERQRERRSLLDGHGDMERSLARREVAYEKWQEREQERKRERQKAEYEQRRREAMGGYTQLQEDVLTRAATAIPDETTLQECQAVQRRIATLVESYDIDPATINYRLDGDRLVVDGGDGLPADLRERVNDLLVSDGMEGSVREVYAYFATMRDALADMRRESERLLRMIEII